MRIGFCGSHRTGKTTLAKALAEKYGYEFIDGSATRVFDRFNVLPNQLLSVSKRFEIQIALLDDYLERVVGRTHFVTDRTPLDYIAYTMAEMSTAACSADDMVRDEQVEFFIEHCQRSMASTLDAAILVPPAIPVVFAEGKGHMSKTYINHVASLISDAAYSGLNSGVGLRYLFQVPKATTSLDDRLVVCSRIVDDFEDAKTVIDDVYRDHPAARIRTGSSSLQ